MFLGSKNNLLGKITEKFWEKSPKKFWKNHRKNLGKITEKIWEKSPNFTDKEKF